MSILKEIINTEMRRKMKNDVLPEVIRFTESAFPYLEEYDIDKLDRIVLEDSVMANEVPALFTIEFDPWINMYTAKCSFYALSADIDRYQCSPDGCRYMALVRNDEILTAMRKALSDEQCFDYEISYDDAECYDEEPIRRTAWTAKTSFSSEYDLYTGLMQAYNSMLYAIGLMYEAYETYAIKNDLAGLYQELGGRTISNSEVLDIELTAPVYTCGKLMDEYDSYLVEGFSSLRRIYRPIGMDITSTEISVEKVKAKIPSVFISTETLLEEEADKLDPDDFEYKQSFSVGKPGGNSRSISHGKDVVARFYYVSPDIYVLEPLMIFLEDDNTEYLIVTKETDGSFHFFTNTKDEIAIFEKTEDSYRAIIKYRLRYLAPFIVAVNELIFEPDHKQECDRTYDEDLRFRRMNEKIVIAKEKMRRWFKDDDYYGLFRDPAANLFSYIKRENCCEGILTGEEMSDEDIFFVQDTKNRSFGIDIDKVPDGYDIVGSEGRQLRLSDF